MRLKPADQMLLSMFIFITFLKYYGLKKILEHRKDILTK